MRQDLCREGGGGKAESRSVLSRIYSLGSHSVGCAALFGFSLTLFFWSTKY